MAENLQMHLSRLLTQSLSPKYEERKAAEDGLTSAEKHPGFIEALLKEVAGSGNATSNSAGCIAASVYLKNYVRTRWNQPDEQGGIPQDARAVLKVNLLTMYFSHVSNRNTSMQLAECLAIIAEVEFPVEWPDLLHGISQHLTHSNLGTRISVLEVLHTVLRKYRSVSKCSEVLIELKIILEKLPVPFLKCFVDAQEAYVCAPTPEVAAMNAHTIYLCCKIFYSFNVVDLPEWFEDHMEQWFGSFTNILGWTMNDSAMNDACDSDAVEYLRKAKSQICDNMRLYSDKYQEEFAPFVLRCIASVWTLLETLDNNSGNDPIVCAATQFLASTAQTNWELSGEDGSSGVRNPFADADVLRQLCTKLILPSVHLRDCDLALMEENPQEFLYKDLQGGDQNLRRTSALELVKALGKLHDEQITSILLHCISALLEQYARAATDAAGERLKEACTYLMIAIAVRGMSRTKGVTMVNQQVDIFNFYYSHLENELVRDDLTSRIICRCAAMKYISTFRNQFPIEVVRRVIPIVARHLTAKNAIVHSNAAFCLERFLTLKRDILDLKIMTPVLTEALDPLLNIICASKAMPDNEYAVKCLLRVFIFLDTAASPVALQVLKQLLEVVKVKANNPTNPIFNHYLFEVIGIIVKIASTQQFAEVERSLVPVIDTLIQQGMHDFTPYCLQILGLILDLTSSSSDLYINLFSTLMDMSFWNVSHANVPGLIRLMSAYFRKSNLFSTTIEKHMQQLFERFQYCVYHKKLASVAFELLNGIFLDVPYVSYARYFQTLITMLLVRIQELNKRSSFCRDVAISLSLFVFKQDSPSVLLDTMNTMQNGLVSNFFTFVFIPNVLEINEWHSRKVVLLALSKLCTSPTFYGDTALLEAALLTICRLYTGESYPLSSDTRRRTPIKELEEGIENFEVNGIDREHFDVVYAQLGSARVTSRDWLENVEDVQNGIRMFLSSVPSVREMATKKQGGPLEPIAQIIQ